MTGQAALATYAGSVRRTFAQLAAVEAPDRSDPAVAEFADQFALDVAATDDAQRAAFLAATGDQAFTVVQRIYVHDVVPRACAALDAIFGVSDWAAAPAVAAPDDSWAAIERFLAEVARLSSLDPVLTEVVRLRGARLHDCALCRSRRSQDALDAGADDATFAAIDDYRASDLPDATRAALALTDAVVLASGSLDRSTLDAVRAHLSPEQVVEVVLDVVRNAANKIAVALAADAASVTDGVELFRTAADGTLTVLGPAGS